MVAAQRSMAVALLASTGATQRVCKNVTVPVNISARTALFGNFDVPVTNTDAVIVALNITRQGTRDWKLCICPKTRPDLFFQAVMPPRKL